MSVFMDRRHAGRALASALAKHGGADVIVLGWPPNGVPVAYEVACALGAPLDIFVARELTVPGHEEVAVGTLASGGLIVLDDEVVRDRRISAEEISDVAREESHELTRREQAYRGGRPPSNIADKTVVLVDDGLTAGATLRAAVRALRKGTPQGIVVAVPVTAPETHALLSGEADEVVCAVGPEPLVSGERWYERSAEATDDEVRELLSSAWRSEPERTPEPVDLRGELTSSNRR